MDGLALRMTWTPLALWICPLLRGSCTLDGFESVYDWLYIYIVFFIWVTLKTCMDHALLEI